MKAINEKDIKITIRLVSPHNLQDLGEYSAEALAKMIGHETSK